MAKLSQSLEAVAAELRRFANGGEFWSLMGEVFGVDQGQAAAHAIQIQLQQGDLSRLARLEVVSSTLLGPARAAYAAANSTIYISDGFLAVAGTAELKTALLEEIGHAIDSRVNASDRPGDEGELFALRMQGLTPSACERQRLLEEDDSLTLMIDGAAVQVEQTAPLVYETTTIPTVSSSASYWYNDYRLPDSGNYRLSGSNAYWIERKGSSYRLRHFNGTSTSTIATSVYESFKQGVASGNTLAYTKSDGQDVEVYRYSDGTSTRLTKNTTQEANLQIDGNFMIWQSYEGSISEVFQDYGSNIPGEIYRYDGTAATRITTNSVEEKDVQLSGGNILWAASDGDDYEIYFFNGTTTVALTNNALDDYIPVLNGNRAAWLQVNNDQENLFFYNSKTTLQVTTNLTVKDPLIAGNNLVFQQLETNGDVSLKLYDGKKIKTLSSKLATTNVQVSGNLVAWLEANTLEDTASIKVNDGKTTRTVASNVLISSYYQNSNLFYGYSPDYFQFRGTSVAYVGYAALSPSKNGDLFMADATTSSTPVQVTTTQKLNSSGFQDFSIENNRILWVGTDSDSWLDTLRFSQPATTSVSDVSTLGDPKPAVIGFSGTSSADTLIGDATANVMSGLGGKDTLTGNAGADKFDYRILGDSLLASFDRITDFDATNTGDRFLVSTARAGFLNGGQVTNLVHDAALTSAAITTVLTSGNFLANFAATITMGSGVTGRSFVVINDAEAGFNANNDAVIEVSGFTGTFATSQFVTS
jgi:hypothetical protein